MTPLQGEPPKLDFKLPKKLKRWLVELRKFVTESQPINGSGLTVNQTPKGRLLKLESDDEEEERGTYGKRYEMADGGATRSTDEWVDGEAHATPGGAKIVVSPPYDSVSYKGPRIHISADHVQTMTDSNGDTTTFNAYVLTLFTREMIFDGTGQLRKITEETENTLFTSAHSILTQ